MAIQNFLTLTDLSPADLSTIVHRAIELKKQPDLAKKFDRSTLGLVFEKSSTRTRVAFEVAMNQLGGSSVFLTTADSQLGRGEPIEDSARVLSRMLDCIAIRTYEHSKLVKFAEYSKVPLINALSDDFHPCQLLADMQTYIEHRGSIAICAIPTSMQQQHSILNWLLPVRQVSILPLIWWRQIATASL